MIKDELIFLKKYITITREKTIFLKKTKDIIQFTFHQIQQDDME
jgi:hypothetical protein